MRTILAGALVALLVELILALAFWAGWAWLGSALGGAWGGALMTAIAAIVLALAGSGDLEVDFDSAVGRTDVRCGRLARVVSGATPQGSGLRLRIRILFVSWTRDLPPARAGGGRSMARGLDAETLSRLISAAVPALNDLFWESRELSLVVRAPTGMRVADQVLVGLVGERRFGPAKLSVAGGEKRAVSIHYRIPLYRAALTFLAAFAQAQPQRLARALREGAAPARASAEDSKPEGAV